MIVETMQVIVCTECGWDHGPDYMLRHDVWLKLGLKNKDSLCLKCLCKKLKANGMKLEKSLFLKLDINNWIRGVL